jgi:cytochrome c biogenesis protein CcdA
MKDISFPLAFFAGVLSFLSPCVLPLVPSYVSFITGISFKDLTVGLDRKRVRYLTLTNSVAFIAGFSTVFIALGVSSSAIGKILIGYMDLIRVIGGILIIIFGLFISGFLKLDFLMKDKKIHLSGKPAGRPLRIAITLGIFNRACRTLFYLCTRHKRVFKLFTEGRKVHAADNDRKRRAPHCFRYPASYRPVTDSRKISA